DVPGLRRDAVPAPRHPAGAPAVGGRGGQVPPDPSCPLPGLPWSMPVVDLDRVGRYDCLYLSPHGDDVAFSCPGRIRGERLRGESVLVLALFESRSAEATAPGPPGDLPRTLARLGADLAVAGLPPARRRQRGGLAF